MRRSLFLALAFLLAVAAFPARAQEELSPDLRKRIRSACFEIVVPKPEQDSLRYEKPLPWDLVPFAERNDKFYSVGTAFAVSEREMVTAFHVFSLGSASRSFQRYFIRDASQNTWEVDQVLAADEHRDVVRFSVKDKRFTAWLDLRPDFELNETVYTVGNAYGEGILIRRGELVGSIPEPMEGAFQHLKSSADVNSGNSGGPLVDARGRVLGLVVQRRDNLAISLPTSEFKALKVAAVFHTKVTYSFALAPQQRIVRPRDLVLPTPAPITTLREQAVKGMQARYDLGMGDLMQELSGDYFPTGKSAADVLRTIPNNVAPEVYFRSNETNLWDLSDLEYKGHDLPGGGRLILANAANLSFLYLKRPEGLPVRDLFEKPRLAMDLILQGVRVDRTLGSVDTRVLSYGDPVEVKLHTDRWGRIWWGAVWHQEFSDQVKILYGTLVPEGLAMVLREDTWSNLHEWTYDLARILDLVAIGYDGTRKSWEDYLAVKEGLPAFLKDLTLEQGSAGFQLKSRWIQATFPRDLLAVDGRANLHLNFGYEPGTSGPQLTLRRFRVESESGDFVSLMKHTQVPSGTPENKLKPWRDVIEQKSPYDRRQSLESGHAIVAEVHPLQAGHSDLRDLPSVYTIYLSEAQGPKEAESLRRLDRLAKVIVPADLIRDTSKPLKP
ncbi:MAG: serine protease [Holophagaceae bacterium]